MRGSGSASQQRDRMQALLGSATAVLAYVLALPFSIAAGEHRFMRTLLKACYYSGRLLALMNLSPVKERDF